MVKISNTYLFGKVQNAQKYFIFCFCMYYVSMKYLNSKEVSDILGVNISTLKRWTDNGTINCHKTPGDIESLPCKMFVNIISRTKKLPKVLMSR